MPASQQRGAPLEIRGTASDSDGRVAGVEVKVGAEWHRAEGRESWRAVVPSVGLPKQVEVSARAVDDSGNLSALAEPRSVEIEPAR